MHNNQFKDMNEVFCNLSNQLREYILTNDIKSLIIGISGGLDSLIVAMIAHHSVIDLPVNLLGYYLPSGTNKPDEKDRALRTIKLFCDYGEEINITESINTEIVLCNLGKNENTLYYNSIDEEKKKKIQAGNIKARIRMLFLFNAAKEYNGIVLGTGNYTEYMLNFFTLNGDCGDIEILRNIWKSEVYSIAYSQYFNLLKEEDNVGDKERNKSKIVIDTINAIPTDGLGISSSDFDQFNLHEELIKNTHPRIIYSIVEDELKKWYNSNEENMLEIIEEMKETKIIQLHKPEFKRNHPKIINRPR